MKLENGHPTLFLLCHHVRLFVGECAEYEMMAGRDLQQRSPSFLFFFFEMVTLEGIVLVDDDVEPAVWSKPSLVSTELHQVLYRAERCYILVECEAERHLHIPHEAVNQCAAVWDVDNMFS